MTVAWVKQRLKAYESIKDHPQSGRPQVIRQVIIKKAFENDPCQKKTRLAEKKISSLCTVSRIVKKMRGKRLRRSRKSCWVQQWFRCVWRGAPVYWMTRISTGIESSYFKSYTVDPVFNKQFDRVVAFGIDVSKQLGIQPQLWCLAL